MSEYQLDEIDRKVIEEYATMTDQFVSRVKKDTGRQYRIHYAIERDPSQDILTPEERKLKDLLDGIGDGNE